MDAEKTPQASVNRLKGHPSDCDLTIMVLWSCLGTIFPPEMVSADGRRFESGTVWEYEDALDAKKPVWVYRQRKNQLSS